MNRRVEHSRMKEYIVKTSLLHYHVDWKLAIVDDVQPEIVFLMPRSDSVMSSAASKFSNISSLIFKTEVCHHLLESCTVLLLML